MIPDYKLNYSFSCCTFCFGIVLTLAFEVAQVWQLPAVIATELLHAAVVCSVSLVST